MLFDDISLNEMDYRMAAKVHGSNYNAKVDKREYNNPFAMIKANKSNKIKLSALSRAVKDNFPDLILTFMEEGDEEFYGVVLHFDEIQKATSDRIVFSGKLIISGYKVTKGSIEYNFESGHFYRVIIMANGAIRRTKEIEIDPDYKETFDSLLTFISNYVYAREDYETEVNNKLQNQTLQHSKKRTK